MREFAFETGETSVKRLYRMAGLASWILLAYCLITLVQLMVLGGPPATAQQSFDLLQSNRLTGLLRLDSWDNW